MKNISTHIAIAAPPKRVWRILTDFVAYPEWNPFITFVSGLPEAGSTLNVRIVPPGGKAITFKPVVLVARPNVELRWKGRLILPGLFDGEHYFQLTTKQGGTVLTQGESFSGLLVGLLGSGVFIQTESGFAAMNAAIKHRAENGPIPQL